MNKAQMITENGQREKFLVLRRLTKEEETEITCYLSRQRECEEQTLTAKKTEDRKDNRLEKERSKARQCRNKAESGDAKAQKQYGDRCFEGRGVRQNLEEAFIWYQMAAGNGDADAKVCLGDMYRNGWGTKVDMEKALNYYRAAVLYEHPGAQRRMGDMYRNGWGVRQNYAEAMKWYRKAAVQNDLESYFLIGYMYEMGLGIKKDYEMALHYYEKNQSWREEKVFCGTDIACSMTTSKAEVDKAIQQINKKKNRKTLAERLNDFVRELEKEK